MSIDLNAKESLQAIVNDGRLLLNQMESTFLQSSIPLLSKDIAKVILMCPHALTTTDDYWRFKAALRYQLDDVIEYLHSIPSINITDCA